MLRNSKLKNMIELSSRLTVYVPSTKNINEVIDNTEYVNKTASMLSEYFGGATATEASGYWTSPTMGLVKERSTMIFAYCKEADLNTYVDSVVEHCEYLKEELKQDSIALEINGKMYFIWFLYKYNGE